MEWIAENSSTIIISVILIAAAAWIIADMIRGKNKGKTSCGCGCSGCHMSGSCHSGKKV